MRRRNGIRITTLLASFAVLAALAPAVAAAETFNVTTSEDVPDGKGCTPEHCTLREAVERAGSSDSVGVPAGTYVLELGELFLTSDTIRGKDARSTIIDGGGKSRVLWIVDGTTTVSGVTIRGGNGNGEVSNGTGGGVFVQQGAILNLNESTVTQSRARIGGGIAATGNLSLIGSTVSANQAAGPDGAGGGGIATAPSGSLVVRNSTISNNTAEGGGSQGGGVLSTGSLFASNVTIAGNRAETGGGLYVADSKGTTSTVSNSVLTTGAGGACGGPGLGAVANEHNVVGDDSCQFKGEGNQQGANPLLLGLDDYGGPTNTQGLNPASPAIDAGSRCEANDQRGVKRPQPLEGLCDAGAFEYRAPTLTVVTVVDNEDGGTATPDQFDVHVLLGKDDVPGSPLPGSATGTLYTLDAYQTYTVAADPVPGYSFAVSGHCPPNGNIGLVEGQNRTCTITATDQAATLRVSTKVVNDNGGTRTPGQFFVRVHQGGTEVANGPGNETATAYPLDPGSYVVSLDAVTGYTFTFSGDCTSGGAVTLAVGDSRSCTIAADDDPPPPASISQVQQQPPPPAEEQLPPPEAGENVNALPKSGTVKVKLPGTNGFVALADAQQLPVGTVIDARNGHVTLVAAADKTGDTATAEFWAGIFKIGQTGGSKPITTLALTEKLSCPKRGKASAAAKRKKKRRLWGSGEGRFRTEGEYSSATVRGTKWLVQDRCDSTLTRVVKGNVSVRDFVKKKTVIVKAGKKYVAKRKR